MNNLAVLCLVSIFALMAGSTRAQSIPKLEQADAAYDAKNHEQALPLYRAVCEAGEAEGCVGQAKTLRILSGEFQYPAEAVRVLNRSCDLEYGPGCSRLAAAYLTGDGVPQSGDKARTFFERGCNLGDKDGCHEMGLKTRHGQLGDVNTMARAFTILNANCDAGFVDSCISARNVVPDGKYSVVGMALIRRACDLDVNWCDNVALSYEQRIKTATDQQSITADKAQAQIYHKRACEANYRKSCKALAAATASTTAPVTQIPARAPDQADTPTPQPAKTFADFNARCSQGFAESCKRASLKAPGGKLGKVAIELTEKACDLDGNYCDLAAYSHLERMKASSDLETIREAERMANEYFTRACQAGRKLYCGVKAKPKVKAGSPGYRKGQRTSFAAMMKAFNAKRHEDAMAPALASCVEEFEWEACMMVDVLVYTSYGSKLSQSDISKLYDTVSSACIADLKRACGPAMSLLYAANPPTDYSSAINRLSLACRDTNSSKDRACKAMKRLRTHQKIDAVQADWQCQDNMGRTVNRKIGVSAYNRIVKARNSLGKCHTREMENRFRRLNDIVNEYDGYVRIDGNQWAWNVNAGCDCFDKLTQKMNALNDREIRFVKHADQKMDAADYWLDRYRD